MILYQRWQIKPKVGIVEGRVFGLCPIQDSKDKLRVPPEVVGQDSKSHTIPNLRSKEVLVVPLQCATVYEVLDDVEEPLSRNLEGDGVFNHFGVAAREGVDLT